MKIKEWAEEDRPREKMLLKGIASLSDAELLAILIGSGNSRETAVQLSQRILNSVNNNLNALGKLSVKELMSKFKGIGKVKAITINAALELGKRRGNSDPVQRPVIHSSSDVYRIFYPLLCDLPHEELWIALTNRSSLVIEKVKISQGGISETSAIVKLWVTKQKPPFPVINCQLSIVNCQLIRTFVFKLKKYEQRIPPNRRSDCRHA